VSQLHELNQRVAEMAHAIRSGELDPLELHLTQAYKELQQLAARIDSRLDIDEMLNDILGTKVTRVQELARILAAPELYVSRLESLGPMRLARLIRYRQPVIMASIQPAGLNRSLDRILRGIDLHSRQKPVTPPPVSVGVPEGFVFATEDSIFREELDRFAHTRPKNRETRIDDLLATKDFDQFLKRFLFIVMLISRGIVSYDPLKRVLIRS